MIEDTKLQALKEALKELRSKTSYEGTLLDVGEIFEKREIPLFRVIPIILPKLGIVKRLSGRRTIWSYSGEITLELCEKIVEESRKYLRDKSRNSRRKPITIGESIKPIFIPGDKVYTFEDKNPLIIMEIGRFNILVKNSNNDTYFVAVNEAMKKFSFKPYDLVSGGFTQEREIDYNTYEGKFCIFHDTGCTGFIDRYAEFTSNVFESHPHKSNNNFTGTENVKLLSEEDQKIIEEIYNKYHGK